MQWIASLFAWLLGVAALTLNAAVYYTVVKMGSFVGCLTAIGTTWRILRDIGNIILIFGFLAIGIATIIDYEIYGWGKKMLPKLLLAAVFLNFSLLVAEAVIDTGNLFATQFYTQINGDTPATPLGGISMQAVSNEGISNKIMAQLGMQGLYGDATVNTKLFEGNSPALIGFLSIILFIIAAFVFFSLAFILIARFVVLLFLIITAPIGFAGLAVPKLDVLAKSWWSELFEQTITAPVLLLLLYIALAVITDASFLTGFGGTNGSNVGFWTGIWNGTPNYQGFMSMFLSFIVAMGLLLAVTISAKKLGAAGAAGAMKLAGAASFGVTAWGARNTIGWGLNSAARKFRSSKYARIPVVGRTFAGALDRGAKASFDIRGASIGDTNLLKNIPGGGVDAGKAQTGGYRKQLVEAIKGREEHAKTLELTKPEEVQKKVAEAAAEAAEDAYEANKTPATRLAMKLAQKAARDAAGAAQLGYAKGLEMMPWGLLYRNEKAAKNIRKTVEKSKDQQQIDALMNTIKSASGGTGTTPTQSSTPPSAPPPAGGGTPSP